MDPYVICPYIMCKVTKQAKCVSHMMLCMMFELCMQRQATGHLGKQLHAAAASTPVSWWKLCRHKVTRI